MKNHQENKSQRLKKLKELKIIKSKNQENNQETMLKSQNLDQEDKTEELNHKEKKEKIAKINQEEIIEVEEETPEVFQTETMSDIIATAAAITAKENNTETSQSSVQQYLTALDQDSSTNTNTQQKS